MCGRRESYEDEAVRGLFHRIEKDGGDAMFQKMCKNRGSEGEIINVSLTYFLFVFAYVLCKSSKCTLWAIAALTFQIIVYYNQ
jgi:hypothetical protein